MMRMMRTTVDLPELLLRRAKAHAAIKGVPLKDFISQAVAAALMEPALPSTHVSTTDEPARTVLGRGCSIPLIRGKAGPAMKHLTSDTIHRILEEDDLEHAVRPRRRQPVARSAR